MNKFSTAGFVQEKAAVTNADKQVTFGKRIKPQGYDPANGCLFLLGLAGSGRRKLAELLAAHYELVVQAPESLSPSDVHTICQSGGVVVVVPDDAVLNADTCSAMREHGKVFYLMGEVLCMAQRLGLDAEERERHAALFARMEPVFMTTLHYILQGWKEPEELVADVREMLAMA